MSLYDTIKRDKSFSRIVSEIIFVLFLLAVVVGLTYVSIIVIIGDGPIKYDDIVALDLYIFGAIDILVFGALSYVYQRMQIINVMVIVTAAAITCVNNFSSYSSAVIDAIGALCTVFFILLQCVLIAVPSVIYFLQQCGFDTGSRSTGTSRATNHRGVDL